jgi:hypothetical protein
MCGLLAVAVLAAARLAIIRALAVALLAPLSILRLLLLVHLYP